MKYRSINMCTTNGRNDGVSTDPNNPPLQNYVDRDIEGVGIFNLPVCSMEVAIENYYRASNNSDMINWATFPCNP
jgi:hypothetical protein